MLTRNRATVSEDPVVLTSAIFKKLLISCQTELLEKVEEVELDVYISDNYTVKAKTTSTALLLDVLRVLLVSLDITSEMISRFTLYIADATDPARKLILRPIMEFEAPALALKRTEHSALVLHLRSYSPERLQLLWNSPSALRLMYEQFLQDMASKWFAPNDDERQTLRALRQNDDKRAVRGRAYDVRVRRTSSCAACACA